MPRFTAALAGRTAFHTSSALALVLSASAALAQTAPAETIDETAMEEIVVTGYRASLDAALDVKRNSITAVDAIVAEDIAKFPDQNLAESLQRISGIVIQRDGGEGRGEDRHEDQQHDEREPADREPVLPEARPEQLPRRPPGDRRAPALGDGGVWRAGGLCGRRGHP